MGQVERDLGQQLSKATRGRLQQPLAVDQEDVIPDAQPGGVDLLGQHLGVEGRPEQVEVLLLAVMARRDGEVRRAPVTQEDVARVGPAVRRSMEPVLVAVVAPFQLMRPLVAALLSTGVDNPEIQKRPERERPVHVPDDPLQGARCAQLVEAAVVDDIAERRNALGEEELQGSLVVAQQPRDALLRRVLERFLVLEVVDQGHDQQRQQGDQGCGEGHGASQPSISAAREEGASLLIRGGGLLQGPVPGLNFRVLMLFAARQGPASSTVPSKW